MTGYLRGRDGERLVTVPNVLSGLRLVSVPVLCFLAVTDRPVAFLILFSCALASDFVDGLLARYLNQATELGARLDTCADFATYMTLPFCAWLLWPEVARREARLIISVLIIYIVPFTFSLIKYGRLTSYHTWSAKLSTALIGIGVVIYVSGGTPWVFRLAMPLLIFTEIEETVMIALLPEWAADVPSAWHALKLRRQTRPAPTADA